ncbi:hypothetical protein [Pontixanthobacter aquaemixtae]|uniref:Outer membrane assembly lipoprotein YfiO n=1 Tax=Pontixanthobacter aquaemixtae TaxID=1958940 RepID=A0A844ZVY1_9SPHN|nr:hypothetical protein [Pontixanthobacter aquaemixtae]MXO90917.1 hypothetical protein [Pontixanthobacter aquaemixtae]
MKKSVLVFGAMVSALWASPTVAGGAYCSPEYRPDNPHPNCGSQIAIGPGNDTRVNLFLLLQDKVGGNGAGRAYPSDGYAAVEGRNFFKWPELRQAWLPAPVEERWADMFGTRCQTVESGAEQFRAAIGRDSSIGSERRGFLQNARKRLSGACEGRAPQLPQVATGEYFPWDSELGRASRSERAFLSYLEGSGSFYLDQWDRASGIYQDLADNAANDWVKETARYMVARTALNEAIDGSVGRWGSIDLSKAPTDVAARAEQGFRDYLSQYPLGRYAGSAKGLIRKALWLQGDRKRLGQTYAGMIAATDEVTNGTADLVQELDDKYLITYEETEPAVDQSNALLLATHNLMRMRKWPNAEMSNDDVLKAEELEAQADAFAGHPDLYSFLKASHAFYIADNPRAVLQLVPDAARAKSYTPLDFSRQYLRGLALHALKDRNEEGFWLDLIKGADGMYQRPSIELALARVYETNGTLGKAFAANSPITDPYIRRILLGSSAGPDILKAQVRADDQPASVRSFALFTVLLKQLQHGEYAGYLDDLQFASQFDPDDQDDSLWSIYETETPPLKLFTQGPVSDGYACPALGQTVRTLARNGRSVQARICLGEFYRLNGFDDFNFGQNAYRAEGDTRYYLGSSDAYPGDPTARHDIYISIIGDRGASRDDRAYALYRAIRCYAPSQNNSCGGKSVNVDQRKAWFQRLKRDYSSTKWAQELEYYW